MSGQPDVDLLTTTGTAARQAALPVALRDLHRRVLWAFLATGGAAAAPVAGSAGREPRPGCR